ncbi:hypothetical protein CDD82_6779 [Ophiocordyceps australis]|uniref:Glutamine synthetase n=1 Tax=Ophiocordyceps australis TaxID=1399860 RepID=A0A2C5YVT4_9HYPO|nr:hypothetical protein CDD82_6779 [Ophiocordyceps australis]
MEPQALDALLHAIQSTPIIDNHAHPLLKRTSVGRHDLLSIASEAHGEALGASRTGLAHIRVVNQLSTVLGCEATWEAVAAAIQAKQRQADEYRRWTKTCLAGIQCILVDDGLDDASEAEPFDSFDEYTRSPCKRIVRIETMAQHFIEQACSKAETVQEAYQDFIMCFRAALSQAMADPDVVGFKSVICYRTGLGIPKKPDQGHLKVFERVFEQRRQAGAASFSRLNHPGLNEHIVHCLAGIIRDAKPHLKKPIQFHTGLGDNDMTLTRASPSHLQEFIREYPSVPIVLLHSGYPFVREMGYLATVYANVYADIGEVFPAVSRDGQEGILREILELCPTSKILWSTDGHWFPETYRVAVVQMRQCFQKVLCGYVQQGDLSCQQAVEVVENILFRNSNKVYKLGLEMQNLLVNGKQALTVTVTGRSQQEEALSRLSELGHKVQFVRVCWSDFTSTMRMRCIPIRRAEFLLKKGSDLSLSVVTACFSLLQTDCLIRGATPVGEWNLQADLKTLRPGPRAGSVTTMGNFRNKDGSICSLCPRSLLQRAIDLGASHGLSFVFGFEIEMVFLRRTEHQDFDSPDTHGHAWSVSRAMDHKIVTTVLEECVVELEAAGVHVELLHPESADGQYEIVLEKTDAMEAVDALLYTRQVVSTQATAKGYKMTLHPKPFSEQIGTAAHVHMSLVSKHGDEAAIYPWFYAGVLNHLRAITAFSHASVVSYERMMDGCWAGGTWVSWGTDNRETPLRKVKGSHWEIRCMDGLANPYLAMAAVLFAGINGVNKRQQLTWQDCLQDPAIMSAQQRAKAGIKTRLPLSLQEALSALESDSDLVELLGLDLVKQYSRLKAEEAALIEGLDGAERRRWIIERY